MDNMMLLLLSFLQVTSDGVQSPASPNPSYSATGSTCHFYFFLWLQVNRPQRVVFFDFELRRLRLRRPCHQNRLKHL